MALAIGDVGTTDGPETPGAGDDGQPDPDRTGAAQLVVLVNQERADAGAPPVVLSTVAVDVAEAWSVHLAVTGQLAHNDDWFTPQAKDRALAKTVGENVAFNGDLTDAHRRLMNSPLHRANILNPRFQQIGVGTVQDGTGAWWVTEDFVELRPVADASDAVAPAPAPASGPSPAPAAPAHPSPVPAPAPPGLPSVSDAAAGAGEAQADVPPPVVNAERVVSVPTVTSPGTGELAWSGPRRAGAGGNGTGRAGLTMVLGALAALAVGIDLEAVRRAVKHRHWQDRGA